MKTMNNMKRILSCLLLSAGYILANAQGIIVYKTDGTQIKVPFEQLDSIAAYTSESGPVTPVDPTVLPVTIQDLVTTEWEDGGFDLSRGYTLSFTNDNVLVKQEGNVVYQGPYTLENNVISFDINGTHYESMPGLAGGQSVMIMKTVDDDPEYGRSENFAFIVVKKGATINTKKEDIQGQWAWWEGFGDEDKIVRIAYKFEGDNFEIIIVSWGQRYTGTYTYDKGIVTLNTTAGYTSREAYTGDGWGEGDLDPVTLEGNWSPLNEDRWYAPEGGPFFAIGDEAFGLFLMPSFCTRFNKTK